MPACLRASPRGLHIRFKVPVCGGGEGSWMLACSLEVGREEDLSSRELGRSLAREGEALAGLVGQA